MAQHNETGKIGEDRAAGWFERMGYKILHRNWTYRKYEIDIIASKDNMLHFIEIKTRTSHHFGYPEEAVSRKKMENMMKCAEHYQQLDPQWNRIQYDILSITLHRDGNADYFLIEDIYY
ncbi:MAG: YraN family protein [Chitinophagaceae bacterium]|nr:YraN family protein [Chitinophagaceae bacterium]